MKLEVGNKVTWVSSNTRKIGEVVAIVPAGKVPADVGFGKAGGGGMPRDHESYVIRGRKTKHSQYAPFEAYGPKALYWPFVSLIDPAASPLPTTP